MACSRGAPSGRTASPLGSATPASLGRGSKAAGLISAITHSAKQRGLIRSWPPYASCAAPCPKCASPTLLLAGTAAQAELAAEHAAAKREHERCENNVAKAADAVIAEESISIYVRYVQAVEAARAAWDDLTVICGMEVQNGPRWVDRTRLPGLVPGLVEAVGRGFGHRDESPPGESGASRRSAAWEDFRRRLRENADAEI
jgi:hypothetical protein